MPKLIKVDPNDPQARIHQDDRVSGQAIKDIREDAENNSSDPDEPEAGSSGLEPR